MRGAQGKLPCASDTYNTQEAGTRARTYSTEAPDVCESLACSPGLVVPVYAKSAIMRAGVPRGTGRGGVLASSPSSNTGLHAASHIRCKMVGEATR